MSVFDDSDEDLMIPLSQRLGLEQKRLFSTHEAVTLLSSSSSSSSVAEVVAGSNEGKNTAPPLRRCVTLNDFSPVVKLKKKNTPAKAIVQDKESISLSNSFSSCLTLSSASCHSDPESALSSAAAAAKVDEKTEKSPPSQVSVSSSSVISSSQLSSSSNGRAPAKKISARDCQALISAHFLSKHFKDEEIRKVFSEYEVRFRYDSHAKVDLSVTFVREIINEYENAEERPEDQVIVVVGKDDLVRMVHEYKIMSPSDNLSPHKYSDDDDEEVIPIRCSSEEDDVVEETGDQPHEDLVSFVGRISEIHPDKNITLILTGIAAYYRAQKKKLDESYNNFMRGKKQSNRRKKSDALPSISADDLNDALVDLQIRGSEVMQKGKTVNHYVIERMPDVLALIASIARSVAEAPTKRSQKIMSSMDWFAENDKGASVDLKDMEKDSLRLWRKQLEQFPKVSREVADAIAKVYPTVKSLMNAYDRLDESAGRILLQDLPVGKNQRRVGPDISRKMHLFFTARDGSLFLGKDV